MIATSQTGRAARRALWFDDILEGRTDRIDAGFAAASAGRPQTLWAPQPDETRTAPNRHLLAYHAARDAAGPSEVPARPDPADLRPALGYVNVIEPVDGGIDFRYRVFGTFVEALTGRDMTGRLVSELPASDYVVDHALACYRAAHVRRLPLLTLRVPVGAVATRIRERLVLPLDATRLIVGAVPVGEAGAPVRPAVMSGDRPAA